MTDATLSELDQFIRESARAAELPASVAFGWDGAGWRWIWATTSERAVGEVRIEVTPPRSESTEDDLADAELSLSAVTWSLDRASGAWSRIYLSGLVWLPTARKPRGLLSVALIAAWAEVRFRLARDEFAPDVRGDAVARLRRYLDQETPA